MESDGESTTQEAPQMLTLLYDFPSKHPVIYYNTSPLSRPLVHDIQSLLTRLKFIKNLVQSNTKKKINLRGYEREDTFNCG